MDHSHSRSRSDSKPPPYSSAPISTSTSTSAQIQSHNRSHSHNQSQRTPAPQQRPLDTAAAAPSRPASRRRRPSSPGVVSAAFLEPRIAVVLKIPKAWRPWLFFSRLLSICPAILWAEQLCRPSSPPHPPLNSRILQKDQTPHRQPNFSQPSETLAQVVGRSPSCPSTPEPISHRYPRPAEFMSIENLKTYDPFAEADEDTGVQTKQTQNYIHIRIQQRNGRKTLTTVQGLPKKFDQKKILKVIKKKFACNGTIVNDSEMGEVIQLQGDQRKDVQEFLIDKKEGLELDSKTIKVHGF
ncbi:hypothetical protein BN1708_008304 [Verticillium longisporum]|uniref:SUI1 domain-containing protein n=1 Tax=Verticillium longisporum TaxID=100787 RepID=A0A0G4N2Z9_VERLO|nr:hypothetical protein BN1708_008304 [Verticillium longisporum]